MKVIVGGPNEALIISGLMHSPPTMIVGGRALIIPCIHKVQKLQLSTMTLAIKTERVYTNLGVPIGVIGIAQVMLQMKNILVFFLKITFEMKVFAWAEKF